MGDDTLKFLDKTEVLRDLHGSPIIRKAVTCNPGDARLGYDDGQECFHRFGDINNATCHLGNALSDRWHLPEWQNIEIQSTRNITMRGAASLPSYMFGRYMVMQLMAQVSCCLRVKASSHSPKKSSPLRFSAFPKGLRRSLAVPRRWHKHRCL